MENENQNETVQEGIPQQDDTLENAVENMGSNADNGAGKINPYQTIIDQQGEQIAALIAANQALTQQVTNMIQSGAQLGGAQPVTQTQQAQPTQTFNAPSLATDEDWSLEGLASEIGRKHA